MADISTGRQRGIVPFVDETTGRLPDQYLPQGVIDLQGDLEQAVTGASQSATAAKASETAAKSSADSATQSASAAAQSAESASGDAAAAKSSADGAASSASAAKASETAAASSATAAAGSEAAAKASETAASQSAQTATEQVSSIRDSVERAVTTANSALSKSSSVEQNLNSFKTSVSQTYETKSDASSKQSSLQQSVNNLRTEVSEKYTTKTEFNNLQVGGTNLLAGTNNGTTGWTGVTKGGKVSITAIHSPSKLVDYPRIEFTDSGSSWRVATYNDASRARTIVANSAGKKFTLSFDAAVTSSNGTNKTIQVFFKEVDSTDNIITFGSFSVPNVEVWNHYELTGTSAGGSITNQAIYFDLSAAMAVDGTAFEICNLKLEEGNKATPWSPAPEDFDGKYTSKTEFKQTTDKISATATAASQNASSALSKYQSLETRVQALEAKLSNQ